MILNVIHISGLVVTLNIIEKEYVAMIGGSAGARILVHPIRSMPHPEEHGIMAPPGKLISVSLKQVRNMI